MTRRLLVLSVVLAAMLGLSATAASADPALDATQTVTTFLTAAQHEDYPIMCAQLTDELKHALYGEKDCAVVLADDNSSSGDPADDGTDAGIYLSIVLHEAQGLAHTHKGVFVSKKFTLGALVKALKQRTGFDVVIGGAGSVDGKSAGTRPTVAVSRETRAKKLVAFAESRNGTIYRASTGPVSQAMTFTEAGKSTVQPVTPSPAANTFQVTKADPGTSGDVYVSAVLTETVDGKAVSTPLVFRCVLVNGRYLIGDLFLSLASLGG